MTEPTGQNEPRVQAFRRARAVFSAAAFDDLRAASEGEGDALTLALDVIDEDPDQPRTVFDAERLQSMADSIRAYGVVVPIGVRPPVHGRYKLAFGAYRLRASRLAGKVDIPARVRAQGPDDFAEQIIENQQRAHLTNRDLCAAIVRLVQAGVTNRDIAIICALKDYQVAAFRQAPSFPAELAARMDSADMRALYDLYRQWTKTPAEVLAALPATGTFLTVTESRRIVGAITGKPTGSLVLDRQNTLAATSPEQAENGQPGQVDQGPARTGKAQGRAGPATATQGPVFIVALGDGQPGRLVVDRRAARLDAALVAYPTGIEEVDASQLRIVRIE